MKQILVKLISVLLLLAICGCVAFVFVGCSSTKVQVDKDGGWSVKVDTDWLKRELQSFHAKKDSNGVVEVEFNGYKHDTSEQLAKNAAEFWSGIAILGRLAGATINPAVAGVPLTKGAANAADMTALVSAASSAETAKIAAKAAAKATTEQAKCASGKCTDGTCEDCTAK